MKRIIPYTKEARKHAKALRLNMTLSEKLLWEVIRKKQLGVEFNRQFPILNYIVDFYAKEIGLAIELDGSSHDNMVLEDGIRQGEIEKLGVHFLRFSNNEIQNNVKDVIKKIKKDIEEYK